MCSNPFMLSIVEAFLQFFSQNEPGLKKRIVLWVSTRTDFIYRFNQPIFVCTELVEGLTPEQLIYPAWIAFPCSISCISYRCHMGRDRCGRLDGRMPWRL